MVEKCTKRMITCSFCDSAMSHDQLAAHHEVCEEMKVPCPRYCGVNDMRRGELEVHEGKCPDASIKCPFFNSGCRVELTRKELDEHIEKSTSTHLMKLMAGYNALKADNDRLKADNDCLKARLKADDDRLKADMETLRREGETSKNDIATFKSQVRCEISRVVDLIETPNSKISKSLGCMESLLGGYKLECPDDSILFSIPNTTTTFQCPPFSVFHGYIMRVVVLPERRVELVLLRGSPDGKLKWPETMEQSITLTLYSQQRRRPKVVIVSRLLEEVVPQEKVASFELSLSRWKANRKIVSLYVYERPLFIGVNLGEKAILVDRPIPVDEPIPIAVKMAQKLLT
jgi:hypothetical protein